ncbi:hypothetical protein F751_4547 [Auxenochlorella protothecoides]|uniref:Uncharacterized protein n=1 Tax=Auxenochlorella protothecoides TaxID=3075 RepID=A0A087SNH3_AUXPR|nr:hypothetical protein F751_4547 [Auxenochlorella protothecoides]KFM27277.1 hypothetical protein F751_4547 [Auxenochlorella protothecoides]
MACMNFVTGLGFIIYGLVLCAPPNTALPLGLVIVGSFACFTSLFGLIGSYCWLCCLTMYLVMGCLLTMAQLGIILSLFFNLNGVVANITLYKLSMNPFWDGYDGVRNACLIGRYFFLVALILQAIGMIIAVYLRVRRPPTYDEYKEFENDAERQLQRSVQNALSRLTAASLYAKTSSSSVLKKMSAKYGSFSHDASIQRSWLSRTFGKGP